MTSIMKVYVTYQKHTVSSEYSDEPYGDWSEELDCDVTGVQLIKPDSGHSEEFELGDVEMCMCSV